jgi:restriction system protein
MASKEQRGERMSLWLQRAGKLGEYETRFIEDGRIYATTEVVDWSMAASGTQAAFEQRALGSLPDEKAKTVKNWVSQWWSFSHRMRVGDLVALPSKIKPKIYIGVIEGEYVYDAEAEARFWHHRDVKWIKELDRADIDQDILYSFGAFLTTCRIKRNDAENRIWTLVFGESLKAPRQADADEEAEPAGDVPATDLEGNAFDEISEQIIRKFKGHGLSRVVAALLEVQGFFTYISPPGPDRGVDILASKGPLGFGHPKICVQVKSGAEPIERTVQDQLIGAMRNHKADYGLLVSWGGFRGSITREAASHFFEVRLWTHKEIVQEFLRHYADLPEDVREAVPLKQIWVPDRHDQ